MNLWAKGGRIDQQIEAFTVGNDRQWDTLLAPWDVVGSMAHAVMLAHVGLLSATDADNLLGVLRQLHAQTLGGDFQIDLQVEDVHTEVENRLVAALGDAGKRIHTGRSRNDQVLLDLKLWLRAELSATAVTIHQLADTLLDIASRHQQIRWPGYTHLQIAMPSSVGMWLGAYAETLSDDWPSLMAAYQLADRNPLGSAAGFGSSFPLDRDLTTRLLGFASLHVTSMAAQLSRGKTELLAAEAIANVAGTVARLSMDISLYAGQEYQFLRLPQAFTTGSSIMPHKQNPDVFELIRGHGNRLQALPTDIRMMLTNLPGGYHREYQLLKELLLPGLQTLQRCLTLLLHALPQLEFRSNVLDDPKYDLLFTVETVNLLVQQGVPFREAYRQVGQMIQEGSYQPNRQVRHTHLGSLDNLGLDRVRERWATLVAQLEPSIWQGAIARLLDPAQSAASLAAS